MLTLASVTTAVPAAGRSIKLTSVLRVLLYEVEAAVGLELMIVATSVLDADTPRIKPPKPEAVSTCHAS